MDRLQLILVLFSYCLYLVLCQSSNLVCTKEFCDNYKQMVGCPGLHIACVAQNSTHSGTILRSATPCSCCETCLEHLREGEYCTIGWPGSPVPTSVCGPGLKCQLTSKDEHPICEKINDTECYKQQIAFDEANKNASFEELMGRPSCDGEGYFNPLKCNEEICYCLDKDGNRIFGEIAYSEYANLTMNCECSRLASTFKSVMPSKYPQPTSRCLDDGSFDPIQCFGDKCVCVNSIYGGTVGDQMYDSNKLNQMPCYNHTIHRRFSSYEHECEKIVADKLSEIYRFENEGYTVMEFSLDMCELNGWYKRVREDENSKFCAHKNGTIIGDFILPKDDPEASNMNCQCARASVLTSNPSDPPKPHRCCRNGNYPKVIRKKNGYYCLDENGNKVSKEVQEDEIVSLPCYYDGGYWRNYEEFSVYC